MNDDNYRILREKDEEETSSSFVCPRSLLYNTISFSFSFSFVLQLTTVKYVEQLQSIYVNLGLPFFIWLFIFLSSELILYLFTISRLLTYQSIYTFAMFIAMVVDLVKILAEDLFLIRNCSAYQLLFTPKWIFFFFLLVADILEKWEMVFDWCLKNQSL